MKKKKFLCIKSVPDVGTNLFDFINGQIYESAKMAKRSSLELYNESGFPHTVSTHPIHYMFDDFFREHFIEIKDNYPMHEFVRRYQKKINNPNKIKYTIERKNTGDDKVFASCNLRYFESGTNITLGAFVNGKMSDEEILNIFRELASNPDAMEVTIED